MEEADLFKALSDPTRLRLTLLLAVRGETCVCVLGQALGEPEFKISRALGVLRRAGVVEARREGTWMHYRLPDPRTLFEKKLRACLRDGFAGHPDVRADLGRLARAKPAGNGNGNGARRGRRR
jgi:ArsR family transcriptional regulator